MLSVKKMAQELERAGVTVVGYQESKSPKVMDGEVSLENSLSVQVGFDYACLCHIEKDDIDYLLEMEELYNVADFAKEAAKFIQSWQSPKH